MTELSPSARAVLTAVTLTKYDVPPEGLPAFAEEMAPLLAAALRAAVNEVAPEKTIEDIDYVHQSYVDGYKDALDEILNLADKLEALNFKKPSSLKEQALDLINRIEYNAMTKNAGNEKAWDLEELEGVRRALKRLQELEKHDD